MSVDCQQSTALLVAGGLDDVRVVVESLSDEFDVVDIAAAAVKLAHAALAGDGDEQEVPPPPKVDAVPRGARAPSPGPAQGRPGDYSQTGSWPIHSGRLRRAA